uniref:Ovule protein n=1 Tax=Ascaris lumbricoides TaxID=6252 RepID=A0A0M3IDL4_ASCLU
NCNNLPAYKNVSICFGLTSRDNKESRSHLSLFIIRLCLIDIIQSDYLKDITKIPFSSL